MAKRRSGVSSTTNRPPPSAKSPRSNVLLAALPPDDYTRVAATLDLIPLPLKQVIHKPGESIQHTYFPGGGFCSLLTVLADGGMVEVATIGREGMVGLPMIFEGSSSPSLAMVQAVCDECYRMPAAAFRVEMNRRGAFHELLTRYGQALVGTIMQGTACNAIHSVEQRLGRWLLMAHDRVSVDQFPLTQEFVAMMLGAARPTVTLVAGTLQQAGLITYHRGQVTVVDRKALERASCECYRAATDLLRAVTSGGDGKSRPR